MCKDQKSSGRAEKQMESEQGIHRTHGGTQERETGKRMEKSGIQSAGLGRIRIRATVNLPGPFQILRSPLDVREK